MPDKNAVKILLAEDDRNLGSLLCEYLIAKGYHTILSVNGDEAYQKYTTENYDLCIFDVMMPLMDGLTLARKIRSSDPQIPIIFLTAKSMKEDTLSGFKSGGDDYITKPFSMEELLYRIKAILKRAGGLEENREDHIFKIGKFTFDSHNQIMAYNGQKSRLSSKESQLLKVLCQNTNQAVQRENALKHIWGDDSYFNARSMDVYISKLRKRFREDREIEILNIHGKGFKLITGNS